MIKRLTLLGEVDRKQFLVPFILVTSLFFLWGFAHSLLDVLNKHFQEILHITRAESGLVQFSVYGGYFLAALPAGYFMNRFGYKRGIVAGLLLYALGAFFFYPAAYLQTFWAFLTGLLIIAFGLAFLETAANPYISVLGPKDSAERRLNLSQSFNGLGWIFGPLEGGMIIFGMTSSDGNQFTTLTWPYIGVGFVVLLVAILFIRTPLPEIMEPQPEETEMLGVDSSRRSLWSYPHFVLAVSAQFFYVAAQTGINSFFYQLRNRIDQHPLQRNSSNNPFLRGNGSPLDREVVGKRLDEVVQAQQTACSVCRHLHRVDGAGCTGLWLGLHHRTLYYLFFHVDHVSYHLCAGAERIGNPYKKSLVIPGDGHCGWSAGSATDGLHCRPEHHAVGLSGAAALFCVHSLFWRQRVQSQVAGVNRNERFRTS